MNPSNLRSRYPLFDVLPSERIDAWCAAGRRRAVSLGETLFEVGSPGTHAYWVGSGRVRVLRAGAGQKEITVGKYGPGELFGEYALLAPGKNTATCRAAAASEVVELPLGPIREAIEADAEILRHLKRWLRLHALVNHVREQSFIGFMSAATLAPMLERVERVSFPEGRTIQADGLSSDRCFVVAKGAVREVEAGRRLLPGECFGAGGLLGRTELLAIEATAPTECLVLRREAFTGSLHERSGISVQTHATRLSGPRAFPWVGQQEATDCGLASLAMISRCFERAVPIARLRDGITPGSRGLSLLELKQLAFAHGFTGQAVRIGDEQLADVTLPAIAHFSDEHYVVLYAAAMGRCVVGDPATAVVEMPAAAFRQKWSGHLLLLHPK